MLSVLAVYLLRVYVRPRTFGLPLVHSLVIVISKWIIAAVWSCWDVSNWKCRCCLLLLTFYSRMHVCVRTCTLDVFLFLGCLLLEAWHCSRWTFTPTRRIHSTYSPRHLMIRKFWSIWWQRPRTIFCRSKSKFWCRSEDDVVISVHEHVHTLVHAHMCARFRVMYRYAITYDVSSDWLSLCCYASSKW